MKRLSLAFGLGLAFCVAAVCLASVPDQARSAEELAKDAAASLEKADFAGALRLYAAAAKAAPEDMTYRQQFGLVRRVMQLRDMYEVEETAARRELIGNALRAFYYDNGVLGEALALDEGRFQSQPSAESASMLAETRLELGQDKEASDGLQELKDDQKSPRTQVLLAIALARQGQKEQAAEIADTVAAPKKDDAIGFFERACMHCLLGDTERAGNLLTSCFENTLPSRLDQMKERANQRADLDSLKSAGKMKDLLAVKSKVKESSCSGGSSCAGCPSRGSCGSSGTTGNSGGK